MKALSIRQPWAWLIANGYKDVENRSRNTTFRGSFLIHASAKMTRADYEACLLFIAGLDYSKLIHASAKMTRADYEAYLLFIAGVDYSKFEFKFPTYQMLRGYCGGIVGQATLENCVTQSDSPWFTGEFGWTLSHAKPLPFVPCKGQLNFFTPKPWIYNAQFASNPLILPNNT